jgi:hypothetical protein
MAVLKFLASDTENQASSRLLCQLSKIKSYYMSTSTYGTAEIRYYQTDNAVIMARVLVDNSQHFFKILQLEWLILNSVLQSFSSDVITTKINQSTGAWDWVHERREHGNFNLLLKMRDIKKIVVRN